VVGPAGRPRRHGGHQRPVAGDRDHDAGPGPRQCLGDRGRLPDAAGIAIQATGVAGWASAYFYATDPDLERSIGSAVIQAANNDLAHLFAFLIPGAFLVVLGQAGGAIGLGYYLWRSIVEPRTEG
jgi:hypothetical protein